MKKDSKEKMTTFEGPVFFFDDSDLGKEAHDKATEWYGQGFEAYEVESMLNDLGYKGCFRLLWATGFKIK